MKTGAEGSILVIASDSEAIQRRDGRMLDCFVALLLAMTARIRCLYTDNGLTNPATSLTRSVCRETRVFS